MNSKPKIITTRAGYCSTYDFEGTLKSVLEHVQDLIAEHGETARLDYDKYYTYEYDHEPSPRYHVIVEREETAEEVKERLKKTREDNAARTARERAEFERLAKKYGTKQ